MLACSFRVLQRGPSLVGFVRAKVRGICCSTQLKMASEKLAVSDSRPVKTLLGVHSPIPNIASKESYRAWKEPLVSHYIGVYMLLISIMEQYCIGRGSVGICLWPFVDHRLLHYTHISLIVCF